MKNILMAYFILFAFISKGQNMVLVRTCPDNPVHVEIKWYTSQLVTEQGCDIYRKEGESEWKKVNERVVKFKGTAITKQEQKKDPELQNFIQMLDKKENLKDLILLATVLKSFRSEALSRYLGIFYLDTTAESGKVYRYKICSSKNNEEPLAVSESILTGKYDPIDPPRDIELTKTSGRLRFHWKKEPQRYFGVNIYRKRSLSDTFIQINRDPIIISGKKKNDNETEYTDFFFEDPTVRSGDTCYYQLEALDFFGTPSLRSKIFKKYIRDEVAPACPDSVWIVPEGRRARVRWIVKSPEADLSGYNIYRTTKNDSDYTRRNTALIPRDQFEFEENVGDFGSYLYRISSVDKDSNERISNPLFVEVFDNEPPGIPADITIISDSVKITLRWKLNPEKDLKGYHIYRTINSDNKEAYVKLTPQAVPDSVFEDVLPANSRNRFYYKICSVDHTLNRSEYSQPVSIRLPDLTPPARPFLQKIELNAKGKPQLFWFANAEPDLKGYDVYRISLSDTSAKTTRTNVKLLHRESTHYTDRNPEAGVYEYFIVARDSAGNQSGPSNKIKIRIRQAEDETEPEIKISARYNSKKGNVEIMWKVRQKEELRGFVLFRKNENDKNLAPLTGCTSSLAYLDHNVSGNAKYIYQLRVYKMNGDVHHSELQVVKTE